MAELNPNDSSSQKAGRLTGENGAAGPGPSLLDKLVSTGLGGGLSPVAPGTAGSVLAIFIYFLPGFEQPYVILPAILVFFAWGTAAAGRMERKFGHDPSRVVIDEIVGMWIALIFLPKRLILVLMAFVLFRVLDIFKPFPASYFDRRNGGLAIMLDDVMCAVYTNLILHLYLFLGR